MTPNVRAWLAAQSPAVQLEISAFLREHSEDGEAFLDALVGKAPLLKRGRVRLLYECWQAVPSPLVLEIAATSLPGRPALLAFIDLASKALLTREDAHAFEEHRLASDPLEEHLSWLRNRAYQHELGAIDALTG